jgi:MEMO1 family protein
LNIPCKRCILTDQELVSMKRQALLSCLIIVICIAVVPSCDQASAYTVRKAVYAGRFYPAQPNELKAYIAQFTKAAQASPVKIPKDRPLKALILPHAGYIYAGQTASYASFALLGRHFTKVVVMGPDHRIGFMGASVSTADAYETPLGTLKLHADAARLRKGGSPFSYNAASEEIEHSVEVVLPYLQYYLGQFSLVPMVMGPGDINAYTRAIEHLMDERTLLVASSDLSHYLPQDQALARDSQTISMIRQLKGDDIAAESNRACGAIPIRVILEIARGKGWEPVVLNHSTSGDATGSYEQVVGYTTIAFFGGQPMDKQFTKDQGKVLVTLARKTIQETFGVQSASNPKLSEALADKAFNAKTGTFVTLTIDNQLRGCIGSLEGRESIVEGVKHNALNAAFRDPRFPALTKKELDKVHIEVSVLTEPKPLAYTDANDLLKKLRPGIDGVIIRQGYAAATFLPQVWEQLPEKEDFLAHLCMKAGLSSDAWKKGKLEVQTYQVQYFEEEK